MSLVPIGEDDLQAYIDGRLEADRRAAVDAYLTAHPETKEQVATDGRIRDELRRQLADKYVEPVPARLRVENLRAARRSVWPRRWSAVAAGLVLFLAGAGGGWVAGRAQAPGLRPELPTSMVAQDASSAYRTFVVEVAHPVEVDASREAHLVQWLSKRLGRKLAAPNLSRFGYRLMGGRLLSCDKGAAAQLMYDDAGGRRLTVYVQAAQGGATAFRFEQQGDASTFAWIDQGFGFAVTATAGRDELQPIAEAVYQDLDGAPGAGSRRG
jgi:anti-sigma factor RsiW